MSKAHAENLTSFDIYLRYRLLNDFANIPRYDSNKMTFLLSKFTEPLETDHSDAYRRSAIMLTVVSDVAKSALL